ncbi:hypothetical protein FQZ97_836770 [compost metagenome]
MDAQWRIGRRIVAELRLAPVQVAVQEEEQREQRHCQKPHRQGHVTQGPEEIHALEEAEEQRRIAKRRQAATDIGHQEDEEHHDVDVVPAVVVGPQQRADQQHGGARGAHQRRQQRAQGQQAGVQRR